MATIEREISVDASGREIWSSLIADPNYWDEWPTPLRGLSEAVEGPVAPGLAFGGPHRQSERHRQGRRGDRREEAALEGRPRPAARDGHGMKGTLELDSHDGHTHVHLTMKSPPMMQAMTGLNTADEMTKTINRIKELGERSS